MKPTLQSVRVVLEIFHHTKAAANETLTFYTIRRNESAHVPLVVRGISKPDPLHKIRTTVKSNKQGFLLMLVTLRLLFQGTFILNVSSVLLQSL